jgi:hypothetical protein
LTWLIPITLLVAVCAMVGGLIARQVYAADRRPAGAPSAPATDSSTPTTTDKPTDPNTVDFRAAARNSPEFGSVQKAMQNYFNAINGKKYALWKTTVTPNVVQSQTQADWANGYRTTKDTDMVVYRIETTDVSLDVYGTFTSHQDPANAPGDLREGCIEWAMVWPFVKSGDGYLIDVPSVSKKAC